MTDLDGTYGMNMKLSATIFDFTFIFKAVATSQVKYTIGFGNGTPSDAPANFVGVRYWNSSGCTTNATDTNWTYVTTSSSTSTTGTTNMPAFGSGGWVYVRIRATTAGTMLFSTKVGDGGSWSSETSVATNVPTSILTPFFYVQACDGNWKDLKIDAFKGFAVEAGR